MTQYDRKIEWRDPDTGYIRFSLNFDDGTFTGFSTGPSPPVGTAGGDLTGTYPDPDIRAGAVGTDEVSGTLKPSGGAADGDETLRALGTGAGTAAKGVDFAALLAAYNASSPNFPTSDEKTALLGTSGTPNALNPYATKATTDAIASSIAGKQDAATAATDAELSAHEADTTNIHGIADTSVLATASQVATAVANHEADSTSVHGIANTAALLTSPIAESDVTNLVTDLGGKQPLDTDLTAIAALTSAADKGIHATGSGTWATHDLTSFARAILDDADAATVRTTLGVVPASGAPTTIQPDDAAAVGTGTTWARDDHKHAIVAAAPGAIEPDDAAAEGSSTSFARADHKHSIVAAAAGAITDLAAEGSATSFARSDHNHTLPVLGPPFPVTPPSSSPASATATANTMYYQQILVLSRVTLTGFQILPNNSTGTCRVALYNSAGTKVADRTSASATLGGALTVMKVAFDSTYVAAPGLYYVGVVFSSSSGQYIAAVPTGYNSSVAVGSYLTATSITPPTTTAFAVQPTGALY